MKLAKREKQIAYGCAALFLIFILQKAVFEPLANKLDALNQEIQSLEAKLIKGLRQEGQRDEILKAYKNYEGYLKIKGSDEEVTSEFLKEIEKSARESGVSLSDIKPRSVNKRAMYKEYTIDIRTEAPMKYIIAFLYRLDRSNLLLRVDKITLGLREESSDILKATMLISGIVLL